MALVYINDTVRVRSTGMPGIVKELQGDSHAQVYLAGQNGTMQFALSDLELIDESDADYDLINSTILATSKSGQTISPVPADQPSFAEVFPDAAADAALTPAPGQGLSVAHPWPGMVGSGLHNVTDADGNPSPVYASPQRNLEQKRSDAAAAREARELDAIVEEFGDADSDAERRARVRAEARALGMDVSDEDPQTVDAERVRREREDATATSPRLVRLADSSETEKSEPAATGGEDASERRDLQRRAREAGIDARQSTDKLREQLAARD